MSCQQNSVMLGHRFCSLPTEFGNARVRVRVNSTSRWHWQLACPYSANLHNPPQMEFSLTAVLLSLILLLNVRHEKNANGRNKYQLETKFLLKADCPIWKDSTRFDPPYITSTITTTSTKYGLKFVTIRSNDQLTQCTA